MKNNLPFLIFILFIVIITFSAKAQVTDYRDSLITRPASDKYRAQLIGRLFLGSHYREVWSAPITMRYLDLQHMKGGLTPLKRGGGFQTLSLRLMGADSNQYVIRTIDKDPSKTVASVFRKTIITDAIQDQISASHPYGFLVAAELAKPAGIYHANPMVLYVPDDSLLGEFRDVFKHQVVLFEERELSNAGVESGLTGFRKVIGTLDLYENLHKSSDYFVDEHFVVRSRLFDMMIGDWDRHEDQWRWAQFNLDGGKKMYRPIPRDRDQAFFNFDGILPTYASLNIMSTRKMQHYKPMPISTKWFNYGARYFDHNFMTRLTRNDWMLAADTLKQLLTDADIEKAFRIWPDTVYKLSAPEIIAVLKARRDNLSIIADKYYSFLAENVAIVGTNKADLFQVKRSDGGQTEVFVYQIRNDQPGKLSYYRKFIKSETKELILYGLDGSDIVEVSGISGANSKVRIVGGEGRDSIIDLSRVSGFGKSTKVYDSEDGNYLQLGTEAKDKTSADTFFNTYSTKSFEYNFNGFFPVFGFNTDDGVFLGASVSRITHGFKKFPYKSKQSFSGQAAFRTGAFSFSYQGDFTDVIGKLNFNIQANVLAPNYQQNFFGYGNETVKKFPDEDYRLRINQALLYPALEAGQADKVRFLFGPIYQQAKLSSDTIDNFGEVFPDLSEDNVSRKHYLGLNTQFRYNPFSTDSLPIFQARFLVNTGYLKQLEENTVNFGFIRGYVSLFLHIYDSRKNERLVLATRFGGGINVGDFEFYQANIIGGRTNENVRGLRGERYSGDAALYNNLEARLKLFHFNAYIFPADFGIIGLFDSGRVWVKNDISNKIHTSYGGGIWLSPFGLAVLSATYAFSDDEPGGLMNIKLGWWF